MNVSGNSSSSILTNRTEHNTGFDFDVFLFAMYGVLLPVIVAFGYIGNILTAIVLWKKEMASANNILLRALVLSDMTMITNLFMFLSLPVLFSRLLDYDLVINVIYNQGFPIINYLGMTSQQCNEYVLVAISVERYIAVCQPLKYAHYKSKRKTIILVCGIITCSILYNIPRLFASTVRPTTCMNVNSSLTCYENLSTKFGESYFYQEVYSVWMYGAAYFVFPLVVLFIMNIFILKELTKMRRIRQNLGVINSPNAKKDSISLSLVIIMTVFGVVQTLGFFNQFLTNASGSSIFRETVNTLYGINSSVNILIYVVVGKKFRRNVSDLFKTCLFCSAFRKHSSEHYQVSELVRVRI